MTFYAYRCRHCGWTGDTQHRDDGVICPNCDLVAKRDYSTVQIGTSFKPHYNWATGQYVSTSREFDDALKRKGEEAGAEYTRIDPGDHPGPPTDSDEILDTQLRTMSKKGFMDERGKVPIDDNGFFIPQ